MMNPEGASSTPSSRRPGSSASSSPKPEKDGFVDISFPYASASSVPKDIFYPRHVLYSDFMRAYNLPYKYELPSSYYCDPGYFPSLFPIEDLHSRFSTTGRISLGLATTNGYYDRSHSPDYNFSKQLREGLFHYDSFLKSKVYDVRGTLLPPTDSLISEFYTVPPAQASKFTEWLDINIDAKSVVIGILNFDLAASSISHHLSNQTIRGNSSGAHHYPYISFKDSNVLDACFHSPRKGIPPTKTIFYSIAHKRGLHLITTLNLYDWAEANAYNKEGLICVNAKTKFPDGSLYHVFENIGFPVSDFPTNQEDFRSAFFARLGNRYPFNNSSSALQLDQALYERLYKNCPITSLVPLPKGSVYPPTSAPKLR